MPTADGSVPPGPSCRPSDRDYVVARREYLRFRTIRNTTAVAETPGATPPRLSVVVPIVRIGNVIAVSVLGPVAVVPLMIWIE